jgi:DNA-binding PadR family transcriptional regulator
MPRRKLDPLPSAAFQILLSLAGGELHGYAIMREVEQQTSGRMRLGPGTLYGSIQTLLEGGLIEEVTLDSGEASTERRRYYRLTSLGRDRARTEAERLSETLKVALAKGILGGDYA